MLTNWRGLILLAAIILASLPPVAAQQSKEILLSQTENAYNPVPNADGTVVAYVRTGWNRPGGSGGFGRSNLRSEVMLMNTNGLLLIKEPIADAFLTGWTSDGKSLICYRDWFYSLVSSDGTVKKQIDAPEGFPPKTDRPERVSYLSDMDSFLWVKSGQKESSIEAGGQTIARADFKLGDIIVPSPNERYIAVTAGFGHDLWVYDRRNKAWTNLGESIISPSDDWGYISPSWNPWFADSSRLTFVSRTGVIVSSPDGKTRQLLARPSLKVGLATPSPDGQLVAYMTFEPQPMKIRPDLKFWGGTTVWLVPTSGPNPARRITEKNKDTTYCLRWLNDRQLVLDRVADEDFYSKARLWRIDVLR